ncbi:hypothetical protein CPB83DRAFT_843739 [Crepidotus variabilis]|uniref:F-box domain-containing protein n=1 Tax=Crepidotus variabilis TaxID=179855 RepID=A0A9P6ESQ3_9AGAR|nr:hypothetical protein CPB83DRAFT_843739 [Crepidotus variabilis]
MTPNQDPIVLLPFDVSSFILRLCNDPVPQFDFLSSASSESRITWFNPDRSIGGIPIQYTFGSVCRGWRQIVWSDPTFWNVLYISINSRTRVGRVLLLKDWLERSAQAPLYLRISTQGSLGGFEKLLQDFVLTIAPHSSRCTMAYLEMPSVVAGRLWHDLWKPHALKTLTVRFSDSSEQIIHPLNIANAAVEKLSLIKFSFAGALVNWEALSEFVGGYPNVREFPQLLPRCVSLVRCSLSLLAPLIFSTGDPPVILNSLKSLELSGPSGQLVTHLVCPNLESLSFEESSAAEIIDFVTISGCQLKKAKITVGAECEYPFIIRLLEALPFLTSLEITAHLTKDFFDRFGALNNTPFLPNLYSLSLDTVHSFPWSCLRSIVPKPRQKVGKSGHRCLSSVRVYVKMEEIHDVDDDGLSEEELEDDEESTSHLKISQQDLDVLLEAARDGIELTIKDPRTSRDLLSQWKRERS